jgi:hypothetical protein
VKSWKILKIGILKAFEVEYARRFTDRLQKESLLKKRRRKLEQHLFF